MAGLAALLSFGSDRATAATLEALSDSLAPRGDDEAIAEMGAAKLLIRAALPKFYEQDDVAMIVDGIAEPSSLFARYANYGPTGLLAGQHPYALIAADPAGAVLARNLDGPPLYYARARGAVMIASEPSALIAAGVPVAPNEEIVARFLETGACDEVPATFFEGIRRVLPGQVVELNGHIDGWAVRAHPAAQRPNTRTAALKLQADGERIGIALLNDAGGDAIALAALVGSAISSSRSVPVYSANFPGLDANSSAFWSALLDPVPDGALKHRALPFFADEFDLDGFVGDLGEPAPGLVDYLLWAIAKASGGEVDILISALGVRAPSGHLSRLADRVAARYGVGLRFPFRELGGIDKATRPELHALAERTLPPASLRVANGGRDAEPVLGEIMHRLRAEVATTLLYPRLGRPDHAALSRLANLTTARRPELDRIWRRFVLERWLATMTPAKPKVPIARPVERRLDVAGQSWQRQAICAEPLASGDRFADILAWRIMEFVNAADKQTRQALRRQWLLVVAGKAVAVAQGEARAIWRIEPGRLARTLVRLAGGRTRHPDPWSMQVAMHRAGRLRICLASLFKSFIWYQKIAGVAAMSVRPPRENACPPAHLAVVGPPQRPDHAAKQILGALRRAVPEEIFDTLHGCAIVSADGEGVRCLGWAGTDSMPVDLIMRLCADNPLGQDDEGTPLLIAFSAKTSARKPAQTGPRRQGKQAARRR